MMQPRELTSEISALARTTSLGGNRALKAATMGTHAAAASPVMPRPTNSPAEPDAWPITQAPNRAKVGPSKKKGLRRPTQSAAMPVSYTHLRAHETRHDLVCRLLL